MSQDAPVAWTPVLKGNGPLLLSVMCHPDQKVDLQTYAFLLSDRVQAMIDQSPDPQEAADMLQELLEQGGMLSYPMAIKDLSEAAVDLIASNPSVKNRLRMHLPDDLSSLKVQPNLPALSQLRADKADPLIRLESWASALSVMP